MIAYCSADAALEKDVPDLEAMPFPTSLDPAPIFGLVVLTDQPAALKTALFAVLEPGQALSRRAGLSPALNLRSKPILRESKKMAPRTTAFGNRVVLSKGPA